MEFRCFVELTIAVDLGKGHKFQDTRGMMPLHVTSKKSQVSKCTFLNLHLHHNPRNERSSRTAFTPLYAAFAHAVFGLL
jgi:hypothetical protein